MQRERRTLSVPTIYVDQPQQQEGLDVDMGGAAEPPPGAGGMPAGWAPQQQQPQLASQHLGGNIHGQLSVSKSGQQSINRSRSASTSALSTSHGGGSAQLQPNQPPKKKIVTACQRCRTRKIRCDGALPACKSCLKAGVECIEVDRSGDNNMPRSHVLELENRIKWLEDIVRNRCPDVDLTQGPPVELRSRATPPAIRIVTTGPNFDQHSMSNSSSPIYGGHSPASTCATSAPSFDFSSPAVSPGFLRPVSPFTFSDTGPSPTPSPGPASPMLQPLRPRSDTGLSNDVGLLSLSASEDSKFVGPSSGVSFARLIFRDCRDPDPLLTDEIKIKEEIPRFTASALPLPELEECVLLSKAYFDTVQLQYPFLHRPSFESCLAAILHLRTTGNVGNLPPGFSLATAQFHIFLVFSIGAALLTDRSDSSNGYYATAMQHIDDIHLTGSLQGAQSALLLAMRSLYASDGHNLWYINSIIMAVCTDLGLHRKPTDSSGEEGRSALKRRIFWSAYCLDRTLGLNLGRPFCIPDEEINADFPTESENDDELVVQDLRPPQNMSYSSGAIRSNFVGAIYLFKMTRAMSAVKSALFPVSDSPASMAVHPSVEQLLHWQRDRYQQLVSLRDEARAALSTLRHRSSSTPTPAPPTLHSSPSSSSSHTSNSTPTPTATPAPQAPAPPSAAPVFSFHTIDLKYHEAVQLLFRPNRHFPNPTPHAFQQCFTSGLESIRIFMKLRRQSELPMTRFTAHSVFMFGITMLWAYRASREVQGTTTTEVLAEDVRSVSTLLGEFERRWNEVSRSKSRFEALAHQTMGECGVVHGRGLLSPHDGFMMSGGHSRRGSSASSSSLSAPRNFFDPTVHHHQDQQQHQMQQHHQQLHAPHHRPQSRHQQQSLDVPIVQQWGGFSAHELSHATPEMPQVVAPGIPGAGAESWLGNVDWSDMLPGGMGDMEVEGLGNGLGEGLGQGMVDDTPMWGMDQQQQLHHQGR